MLDPRAVQPAVFDLADAIRPVITSFRTMGLDVRVAVPCGIEVEGRRDDTAQVVFTLLDNARKHAAMSAVELRVAVCGEATTLYVEDDGIGITSDLGERLFERGVRGDASAGRGLGLFIARRLMIDQGGSLDVDAPTRRRHVVRAGLPHRAVELAPAGPLDSPARARSSHDRTRSRRRGSRPRRHRPPAGAVGTGLGRRDHRRPDGDRHHPTTPGSSSRSACCSTSASARSSAAAST